MDPTRSLELAREAFQEGNYEQAADHFNDIDDWICAGGYLPTDWLRFEL